MHRRRRLAGRPFPLASVGLALAFTFAAFTAVPAQRRNAPATAAGLLEAASRAMGEAGLDVIQYSGTGSSFTVGQAPGPGLPWPRFELKKYVALVNYHSGAMREETVRRDSERPARGGGAGPFTPATGQGGMRPIPGDILGTQVRERSSEVGAVQMALTPHGFLKAAATAGPEVGAAQGSGQTSGQDRRTLTFSIGRHRLTGTFDERYRLERIETHLFNNVLGDVLVETTFLNYRDHAGVMFPSRIQQRQAGHPTLDLAVAEVVPGSPLAHGVVPAPTRAPVAPAPMRVEAEKIADGVWFLNGGAPVSLLVEFSDHVIVIEGPQGDDRTNATLAAVKALTPGKPIRYVVNTHHHFDHSGGIRAFVAAGIPVLTHEKNAPYWERILKNPFTLGADLLSRTPREAVVEPVGQKRVLTDGSMTLELHHLRGNFHDDALLVGYLPHAKMLIQSDAFHPRPGAAPLAAPPQFTVNLLENIERLKLDVTHLVQVHGGVEPFSKLVQAAGR